MAENAMQSAHITSSHSAGGKAGPLCESGAPCAALCPLGSDSDSTQKVDVFQEPVVESGVDVVPARPDATDLLFTRHELPSYSHLVPADCVQSVQPNWQNALSYKGDGDPSVDSDEVKQDLVKFAPAADLQALILSGDVQDAKSFHKDGLFQSSCSTGLVNSTDLESPGSPFEVLIGKNEFTNSSNNSIGHGSGGGTFDSEWLTKSWSSDTVAAGGFHTVPPLYERTAHRDCLVDSQDFQCLSSGQMSDWNIKGLNISGEPSQCPDHSQSVGLNDLSPEVIPKMHLHQVAHAQPLYQSVSSQDEIDLRLSPQKSQSVAKEAEPFVRKYAQSAGLEHNVISLHTMESKSPGSKSYQSECPPFSEHLLDSFELTADSNWPDTSEMAEADSSGESDDTVIEDTKACLALAVKKEAEMVEIPKAADDPSLEVTDLAAPVTLVLVPEREINVEYSPDELIYHEKSKLPYAIPEEDVEFMDDFETLQAPATDFVEGEFKPQQAQFMELSKPEMHKLDTPNIKDSDLSRMFSSEILLKDVDRSVKESKPSGFSLDKTTATSEHPDSVCGERFIDFMKEWSAENNEGFQETLAQVKANVDPSEVYAVATEVQTRISATLRKLPFSETGEEEYCIFTRPGEVASTFSSHDGNLSGAKLQPSPATPEAEKFFLDLDQEKLTITALRELSTIPDESPVSAGESDSPSPKGNKLFQTASPPLESFVSGSEFLSNPRQSEASKEVLDVRPDFPSYNLLIQSSTPKEFHSVEGASSTTELAKGQEFVRPLRCSARDLVFWRDVKKSGVVFGTSLVLLLSLAAFSVISVVAYLMLALLSVTISFRVYRSVIQAVQKKDEGHPFKPWLDVDISVSSEAFHNYMNTSLVYVNKALKVIRLFLVEDLVDSLKLAVFMWLMTYVGAVFNGITLLILGLVLAFTFPIVYEKYQTQIDHYVAIIREQSKSIIAKVHAKLPGLAKKKAE